VAHFGCVPDVGAAVTDNALQFIVAERTEHHVTRVALRRLALVPEEPGSPLSARPDSARPTPKRP
jgi:CBS domain containing-hemolysin-like protein